MIYRSLGKLLVFVGYHPMWKYREMTADAAAKGASERLEEQITINHSDWRGIIRNALVAKWKKSLETWIDKLREIKPEPEIWIGIGKIIFS